MFIKIARKLWGDLSNAEFKKFGLLSIIITIILGNYWMLRVMKNPVFNDLVGMEYQPYAKMGSILVATFVVIIYSKLVDLFSKKTLFDIVCIFYAVLFFIVGLSTGTHKEFLGIINANPIISSLNLPGNFMGWVAYAAFETMSIMIILFWAFVAGTTTPESAKKGYAMIICCIQVGTISGPAVVTNFAPVVGLPMLTNLAGILAMVVPLLVRMYLSLMKGKSSDFKPGYKAKPKTGFFEGIRLIVTKPYVMGILVISIIHEIITTMLDFQMNMIAKEVFSSRDLFASFAGKYGMSVNAVVLTFSFLGTSFFMRKFGIRFCLLAYPTIVGMVLCVLLVLDKMNLSHLQMMWTLFGTMIIIKGLGYSLNNPTKEVIYIPTTDDIRFKAKGWIESFGGKTAKGTGSVINAAFTKNLSDLLLFGTLISLGIVGGWIIVANLLGKKFNRLQKENKIVE